MKEIEQMNLDELIEVRRKVLARIAKLRPPSVEHLLAFDKFADFLRSQEDELDIDDYKKVMQLIQFLF